MHYTKAKIYNITLNNLGITAIVQNTSEVNPRITTLNNYYDMALEQVMKDYDWNFLNRIETLTASTEISSNPKYHYCYDYPNDCLAARKVIDSFGGDYHKFEITTGKRGNRLILCNIPNATLKYTRRLDILTNQIPEAYFTSEFVTALCFYLAFISADSIVGDTNKKQMNYQAYQTAIIKAKTMDANESTKDDENNRTYIDERN